MEGNKRSARNRLMALGILVAAAGIIGCPGGGGTATATSNEELLSLRKDVESLKQYRDTTGKWLDSLWKSYKHAYLCDTDHKNEKKCPVGPNHIAPPNNPPK